jgi:hypothetical protein
MLQLPQTLIGWAYNGRTGWPSDSLETRLGVAPEQVGLDDLRRLSYGELVRLFHAAQAPAFAEMKGEYQAASLPAGVLGFVGSLYIRYLFGPGQWVGKAFFPFEAHAGWGYNLFSVEERGGSSRVLRQRKMATFLGPSNIDGRASFHLDYSPYNGGLNHTVHDELRKICDGLYLGLGYVGFSAGAITPVPFVVHGQSTDWVGPDSQ